MTTAKAIPEGMHTLTPYIWFSGLGAQASQLNQKAIGAGVVGYAVKGSDRKSIIHAMMKMGDSMMMLADAFPGSFERGPEGSATMSMWVYVEDCDASFKRALDAGCEEIMGMMDAFWGDRMGKLKDPFGHCWVIATHKRDLSPEEIAKGQEEFMASMKKE